MKKQTENLVKEYIKTITSKVVLDIVMGYSVDVSDQIKMLRDIADNIEIEAKEQGIVL
jgi:hypothetical protein